uniref:Beta-1,4-N-acetylgalactosaminyltransferase n=1 Tax=Aceria tosichella TaxID=561515 RepID=A0A6G1SCU9_9ACAR
MRSSTAITNIISLELISLLALIFLFVWDLTSSYYDTTDHFNQLDTFDQLTDSIIDCNTTEQGSHDWFDPSHSAVGGSQTASPPKCPIDLDRLRYFDDPALDTWLSYDHVKYGGQFEPDGCLPKQKVAIIVPYRDKQEHLEKFLLYIHQFLPDQLIDYIVFVIEQADQRAFNRMRLLNIGASKVMEYHPDICCFIFHEVDLLPLDQRNLYMCSRMPRHLSGSISSYRYRLLYPSLFGGVVSMSRAQYELIGGFSEIQTYNWYAADEDLIGRIVAKGLTLERTPLNYGVYITAHYQWGNQTLVEKRESEQSKDSTLSGRQHKVLPISDEPYVVSVELKQLYTHVRCSV